MGRRDTDEGLIGLRWALLTDGGSQLSPRPCNTDRNWERRYLLREHDSIT
ncbi:hypothetical protein [Paenibacillus peoriae]